MLPRYSRIGINPRIMAGIDFGDHQRVTLKWAVPVCLCIMFTALLMGIFPLFSPL